VNSRPPLKRQGVSLVRVYALVRRIPNRRVTTYGAISSGPGPTGHIPSSRFVIGGPHLDRVYRAALDADYLWHEFGDLHLILP